MTAPFIIRPLQRRQAAAWRDIRLEALRHHPTAFLAEYEVWAGRDLDAFTETMPPDDAPSAILGAFNSGGLAGTAGFAVETGGKVKHKGVLWGMYVRPAVRGTGASDALIEAVIARAREHVELLKVGLNAENAYARELYVRHGFRSYGVEPRAIRVDGRDYDEELMVLEL